MGIEAGLKDVRQRCPSNKVCQRVAMPELREIPRFNKVLVGQLRSVVEQTEQAAYDVTSRLQTIDEVVTDLNISSPAPPPNRKRWPTIRKPRSAAIAS
jgi:methyl-accepting chemotaxis protein